MGFMSQALGLSSSQSVEVPVIYVPSQTQTVTPTQTQEAVDTSKKDYLAKQALIASKNKTIATSGLGIAPGTLQTAKKTLLGG